MMKSKWAERIWRMPPAAKSGEINHPSIDRFTIVHFGIGVAYGLVGLSFLAVVVLALLWEMIENPLKAHCPRLFPNGTADTVRNMVGDTLAVVLGWVLLQLLR